MIKLEKLDQNIVTLGGMPIADIQDGKTLSLKTALISVCEMHRTKTPGSGEVLQAYDVGLKLFKANNELELEQKEIDFLKKLILESTIFLPIVIGRLRDYIEAQLKVDVKQEVKPQTKL